MHAFTLSLLQELSLLLATWLAGARGPALGLSKLSPCLPPHFSVELFQDCCSVINCPGFNIVVSWGGGGNREIKIEKSQSVGQTKTTARTD